MARVALLVLLALGWLTPRAATGEEAIRVVRTTPVVVDGMLGAEAECASLFSPKSLSTLQCGLAAVLRLELRLQRSTGARTLMGGGDDEFETVHRAQLARSISYDVWDERYTVRSRGRTEVFTELQAAERAAATFPPHGLIPLSAVDAGATYRIQARVQLLPISQEQGERIADWLRDPEQPGAAADLAGGSSFGFDLDGLLSALWGRGNSTRDLSTWHQGASFRLDAEGRLSD